MQFEDERRVNPYRVDAYKAARFGFTPLAQMLIRSYGDDSIFPPESVNSVDEDGATPLMIAVVKNRLGVVSALLCNLADVNAQDNCGRTALMFASSKNKVEMVRMLLQASAQCSIRDRDGRTAYLYARDQNNQEVVKALLAHVLRSSEAHSASSKYMKAVLLGEIPCPEIQIQRNDPEERKAFGVPHIDADGRKADLVRTLCAALQDDDESTSEESAYALEEILIVDFSSSLDDCAVEPLCNALKDNRVHVRRKAARVLGEITDARAVAPLCSCLADEDTEVRWRAAAALGHIAYSGNAADQAAPRAKRCLVDDGGSAVDALCAALQDDTHYEYNGTWIANALGIIKDARAVDPLCWRLPILSLDGGNRRICVARALGAIGEAGAVEPLWQACINNSDESDEEETDAFFKALVKIGAPSVETLIRGLDAKIYGSGEFRQSVARSLRFIGDARAVEPLRRAAEIVVEGADEWDERARDAASHALERIEAKQAAQSPPGI